MGVSGAEATVEVVAMVEVVMAVVARVAVAMVRGTRAAVASAVETECDPESSMCGSRLQRAYKPTTVRTGTASHRERAPYR